MTSNPSRKNRQTAGNIMSRSKSVTFAVSEEVYDILETLAYVGREPISAVIRRIVFENLLGLDLIDAQTPATEQAAATNRRFAARPDRSTARAA